MGRSPVRSKKPPPSPPPPPTEEELARMARDKQYDDERLARHLATRPAVLGQSTVRQLVEQIGAGTFRLPPFQRSFVWTDGQVLHLLDSLWCGYYVGSLLLWESYDILPEVKTVGGVPLSDADKKRGFLVIDGQQRLVSLYQAFTSKRFAYDFAAGKFVVDVPLSKTVLPLHLVYGPTMRSDEDMDILRWIEASDGADHAGRLADDLIYRVVATVGLPYQWSLANVMDMFRRLNTAGTRMGADEVEDALRRAIR